MYSLSGSKVSIQMSGLVLVVVVMVCIDNWHAQTAAKVMIEETYRRAKVMTEETRIDEQR